MSQPSDEMELALDWVIAQLDEERQTVIDEVSRALAAGDFDAAGRATALVKRLAGFGEQAAALRADWTAWRGEPEPAEPTPETPPRRNYGRAPRGARTPEEAYYRPILQTLVELGGQGRVADVLNRVGQRMAGEFNTTDQATLPSRPDTPRWRNTAQWARDRLIKKGLLRSDSPHGTWAISDAGRAWLESNR